MNNLQNKIILLLLFVNLSNQCLKAQNPTGYQELMSIEKSSPCFLGYNEGPGPFQGAPGHDFTSMRHDSDQGEDGALVITGKTHESHHGPLYYTLSEGDDIDCYPGEGLVDISNNPTVELRIKASSPVQIYVYIQEGNTPSWDYSKFSETTARIDLTTDWQVVEIPSISSTNLSGDADAVDLTRIGSVAFELGKTDGENFDDFDGEIYVDYIELGDFVRNDTSLISDSNDSIRTVLQNRLNEGETPFEIYQSGASLESLYGLTYQGGLIAHLNLSDGTGFVAAPNDQGKAPWGCHMQLLNGADGIEIGTGQQNTADILAGCSEAGIAAALCSNLTLGDYSDWFLPSLDELNELYTNLYLRGLGGFEASEEGIYWSSKESGGSGFAWWQEFSDGYQFYNGKSALCYVRAIRNFTDEGFDSCFSLAPNISESTQINCSSTFSTLNANVQGGNPPYTYNWSMSDVSGNDETFKTGKTGSVQLIVKDQAGCSDTSTYVVKTHTFGSKSSDQKIFREDFDFKNESTLPCFLGWDPVAAFQGAPGHDFYGIEWDKENGDMVFSATTNSTNHAPMYYTLTAPSVDGDCFPGEGITDISENPSFEIRLKASTPVTIHLFIQEGNNPSWNFSKFSNSFLTMNLTTEYQTFYLDSISSYRIQNHFGSSDGYEQIDLTQIGGIAFQLGKSDGVNYDQLVNETIHVDYFQFGGYCELDSCKNLRADYEVLQSFSCSNTSSIIKAKGRMGSPGYSYTWPDSPNLLNDSTIEVTNSGFYKIIVSDTQNCTDTSSIYVPENPFGIEEIDLEPFFINSEFRTGFTRLNKLKLINNGCLNASGEIYIVLDHLTTYLQYLDAADRVSGDTLFWSFDNLTADSIDFNSLFDIQTSVLAAIGDTVCFTVALNYVDGQENELKYSKKYCFPIINGYDPNDISVHPSACPSGYVKNTDVLTYKIRFQNTGNAEAININVMDTLSPYLDASTLKVIETSHPDILKTFLLNDSVIKFAFDEIWLKDSMNHEPESHGHVLYQISQKPNLDLGTEIFNKADIYFDYNPAVVTNTVMSTVTDSIPECMAKVTGKSETVQNPGFIYPNPNSGEFTILFEREISDGRIEIFNVEGKSVYQQQVSGNKNFVVSVQLSKGVYFVKLTNEKYIGESKFVVK